MGMSRMVDEWQQSKTEKSLHEGAIRSRKLDLIKLSEIKWPSVLNRPSSLPSASLLSVDFSWVPWPQ